MKRILVFLFIFLFISLFLFFFPDNGYSTEIFYASGALGNCDNPENATGQADAGSWWNADEAKTNRTYQAQDEYVIVRNWGITGHTGPVGLVKLHCEYTYYWNMNRRSWYRDTYRITYSIYDTAETSAKTIYDNRDTATEYADKYIYNSDISDDYYVEVDFTGARSWTWDDIRKLHFIFYNDSHSSSYWENTDAIWLEVGSALEVISVENIMASSKIGLGTTNNGLLLIKVKAHNYTINIDSLNIYTNVNDYGTNQAVTTLKVWNDFNKNGIWDTSDVELASYDYNTGSNISGTTENISLNFQVSGEKWLLITANSPSDADEGLDFQITLKNGGIVVSYPEMITDFSDTSCAAVKTAKVLNPTITDFYPLTTQVASGDSVTVRMKIQAVNQPGERIRYKSDNGYPEFDYYTSGDATLNFDSVVFDPSNSPALKLDAGATGTIDTTFIAGHPGTIYFGASTVGYDTVVLLTAEGDYVDSRTFTSNHYSGVEVLTIVSGLTVNGQDVSSSDVYQYQTKAPFLQLKLDATDQYADIVVESIKVDQVGTASDSDVGTVYLYTDDNDDLSPDGETLLASGTLSGGSITFNLPTDNRTVTAGNYRNVLICADIPSTATENNEIQFNLASVDNISVADPDIVKNKNFPISSSSRKIIGTAHLEVIPVAFSSSTVNPGDEFSVTFQVKNTSTTADAQNVTIVTDAGNGHLDTQSLGWGSADFVSAPDLTIGDLAKNSSVTVSWTYKANHTGQVKFSCYVTGNDKNSGVSLQSSSEWTDYIGIGGNVTATSTDVAPDEIGPGQAGIPMLLVHLNKDDNVSGVTEKANLKSLTIDFSFTGKSSISDISKVSVYRDSNGNGEVDSGEELLGSVLNPSDPQAVDILLDSDSEVVEGTTAHFLITMDVSGSAPIGSDNTISITVHDGGISFYTPVVVDSHSDLVSSAPNIIEIRGSLIVDSLTPTATLLEPGDTFTLSMNVKNNTTYTDTPNSVSNVEYKSQSENDNLYHVNKSSGATISLLTSPDNSPSSSALGKNESVTFNWTYKATKAGEIEFSGWAEGDDDYSNEHIASAQLSSETIVIKNLLAVSAKDLGRTQILPGAVNYPFLTMEVSCKGELDILGIKFDVTATDFADLDYIKVYEDVNGNGIVDDNDTFLGSSSVDASPVTITLPEGTLSLNNSSKKIIVAVSTSTTATANDTFTISIPDETYFSVTPGDYNGVKSFSGISTTQCTIKKYGNFYVDDITYSSDVIESGNTVTVTMNIKYDPISGSASDYSDLKLVDFDSDYSSADSSSEDSLKVSSNNGGSVILVTPPSTDPVSSLSCGNSVSFTFTYRAGHAGDVTLSGWGVATPEAGLEMVQTALKESSVKLHIDNYLSCSATAPPAGDLYQSNRNKILLLLHFSLKNEEAVPMYIQSIKVINVAKDKDDDDLSAVKLYWDVNKNRAIDDSDYLVDTQTFSNAQLFFNISSSYGQITATPKDFIIAVDVDPEKGTDGNQVQLEITDYTFITVDSPNSVYDNNFPLKSGSWDVKDAVTLSVLEFYTSPDENTAIEAGNNFDVYAHVQNSTIPASGWGSSDDDYKLTNVTFEANTPNGLDVNYGGTEAKVSLVSGPASGWKNSQGEVETLRRQDGDTGGDDEHTFHWVYQAKEAGRVLFSGWGKAYDQDVSKQYTYTNVYQTNSGVYITIKKTLNFDLTDIAPSSGIVQGQSDVPVLAFSLSHSVASFTVCTIEVTNYGDLDDNYISSVSLYYDADGSKTINGGDVKLSSGTFNSGSCLLSFGDTYNKIQGNTKNYLIAVSLVLDADDSKNLQIGVDSLDSLGILTDSYTYKTSPDSFPFKCSSTNVKKKAILTITAFDVGSTSVNVGDNITVKMTIKNDGEVDVNNLDFDSNDSSPDELEKIYQNGASVSFVSVDSHPISSLAPGKSGSFSWTYNAAAEGDVSFSGWAKGVDSVLGIKVVSSSSTTSKVTINPNPNPVLSTSFLVNSYYSDDQSSFDLVVRSSNGGGGDCYNVEVYPDTNVNSADVWKIDDGGTSVVALSKSPSSSQDVAAGSYSDFTYTYDIKTTGSVTFKAVTSGNTASDDSGDVISSVLVSKTVTIQTHAQPQIVGFTIENDNGAVLDGSDGALTVELTIKNLGEADLVYAVAPTLTNTGNGDFTLNHPQGATIPGGQTYTFTYVGSASGVDKTLQFKTTAEGEDGNSGNKYSAQESTSNSVRIVTSLTLDNKVTTSAGEPIFVTVTPIRGYYIAPLESGKLFILKDSDQSLLKTYDYSDTYYIKGVAQWQMLGGGEDRYYFILKDRSVNDYYLKGNRIVTSSDGTATFYEDITKQIGGRVDFVGSYSILNLSSDGANSILYIGVDNAMNFYGLPPAGSTTFSFETSILMDTSDQLPDSPIATAWGDYGRFLMFYVNDTANNSYYLYSADPITAASLGSGDTVSGAQAVGNMWYDPLSDKFYLVDNRGHLVRFNSDKTIDVDLDVAGLAGTTGNTFKFGPMVDALFSQRIYMVDESGYIYSIAYNFTGSSDADVKVKKLSDVGFGGIPLILPFGYGTITDTNGVVYTFSTSDLSNYRAPYQLNSPANTMNSFSHWMQKILDGDNDSNVYVFTRP